MDVAQALGLIPSTTHTHTQIVIIIILLPRKMRREILYTGIKIPKILSLIFEPKKKKI